MNVRTYEAIKKKFGKARGGRGGRGGGRRGKDRGGRGRK